MRKYFLIIIFLLVSTDVFCQFFIEDNLRTGYVVNNYLRYNSFPKTKPLIINDFKIGTKTFGKKDWHQVYNYPEISFSIFTGNLGNNKEFGYIVAALPNISFDIKKSNKAVWQISFGWGISYFNAPYDSLKNPHNILIGNKFAHIVEMTLFYRVVLTKNLCFQIGGAYIHSSNGHFQVPNGGLNLATVNIGIKNYFSIKNIIEVDKPKFSKKIDFNISFDRGIHEFSGSLFPTGTPKYAVYGLGLYFGKHLNSWSKFFVGFYGKYYQAFYDKIVTNNLYFQNTRLKASVITFFIGSELKFGHFAVFGFGGINFYKPFVNQYIYPNVFEYNIDNFFELYISTNLGMKYYLLNPEKSKFNIFVAWAVKANFGNADYTYISTGFVF